MLSQGKKEMICNVIDKDGNNVISIKEKRTVYKKHDKEYVNIQGSKIELKINQNGEYYYDINSPTQVNVNTFNTISLQPNEINMLNTIASSLFGTPIDLSKNPFDKK